jgi:hypothetical protein
VAIPTNFQGYTPAANTTKSFKIFGSATVGIWANDVDGTLSAGCSLVPLAPNLGIFMSQAYTDAQINALLLDYLTARGARHDGAGGQTAQGTQQAAVVATTCT